MPLAYEKAETILDYVDGEMIFLSELSNVKERLRSASVQLSEDIKLMLADGTLTKGLDRYFLTANELFGVANGKS